MGRRRLRHPQHRLAAGAAGAGPGPTQEAQVEILESLEVFPSTLPTRRESAYAAWVSISRRLQQHLHVLHRARRCAARRRTAGPATSSPRSRRWSPRASSRSPCSGRTSTPTASSSATGYAFGKLLRACGDDRRAWSGSGSPRPHPRDFTDDVIAAMAETPNVMPQLHMPLQSGSDAVLKAMRRSYRQERTSASSTGCAPRCPDAAITTDIIVGFPGETEDGLRADPGRRRRGAVRRRVHLPVLQAARHAGRRPGRPGAQADVVQERYERLVALRRGDRLGGEQAAGRPHGRAAGRRGRGPQGRRHPPAVRPRAATTGWCTSPLPDADAAAARATWSTVEVTYAAPHHLVADGAAAGRPPHRGRRRLGAPPARRSLRRAAPVGLWGWGCPTRPVRLR